MPKKKKTRKDKEKAKFRRNRQYKSILTKISDGHNDDIDNPAVKEQVIIRKDFPTPGISYNNIYIKKDLRSVVILAVVFAAIVALLVYFDTKYNFLSILANNLINTLTK